MNRYPLWKYAVMLIALLVGLIYTLPNLFGEDAGGFSVFVNAIGVLVLTAAGVGAAIRWRVPDNRIGSNGTPRRRTSPIPTGSRDAEPSSSRETALSVAITRTVMLSVVDISSVEASCEPT